MDGDPIVRQIVNKMYGPDDEVAESVVLYESQVIVSRETLRALVEMGESLDYEIHLDSESLSLIKEAKEILGDA